MVVSLMSSGQRLPAVDAQRHAGEERAGHRLQDRIRDVLLGSDAAGRVAGAQVVEIRAFALLPQRVPGADVDDAEETARSRLAWLDALRAASPRSPSWAST
jgi:hypothetical protein